MIEPAEVERFATARRRVLDVISRACERAGRTADEVQLVAVTKGVDVARVGAALAAGQRALGENRVQEGVAKIEAMRGSGAQWHLIGPLQPNKARAAVRAFDTVDAVDSLAIARRLATAAAVVRPGRPLRVLLQVNVDGDPAKHGWAPDALERDMTEIVGLAALRLDGLMTIGRLVDSPEAARPTFRALRTLSARLRQAWPALGSDLSMGMSDDYAVAVEEGSTQVRVGRALFGERPDA